MSYLLFVDESGSDLGESPYAVLAGIAVEDSRTWSLINAIQQAEHDFFGQRITKGALELKAREILKRKVFRLASQLAPFEHDVRTSLAHACLQEGVQAIAEKRPSHHTRAQLTALAQAKIAFVERVLEICGQHQARAFASIVDRDAPKPPGDFLRKDYSYLFERFFHFLSDRPYHQQGLVVFDELDKAQCHILLAQMHQYFQTTARGRQRASRIVPEPFFVHSDLTSLVQVADLIAYIIAWGVRLDGGKRPMWRERRNELDDLAHAVLSLRYHAPSLDEQHTMWSFVVIDDLRAKDHK